MITATKEVLDLFENVLKKESKHCGSLAIADALKVVRNTYRPPPDGQDDAAADYKEAEYRYAYIYYFCVCHTLVVTRQASRILLKSTSMYCDFMGYGKETLDICSLGGGPGCDLVGLLRLRGAVGLGQTKKINCAVVDVSSGWQHSVKYVLNAYLKSSEGRLYRGKLNFELVRANLSSFPPRKAALRKIQSADIVTLVKFVSAVPGENTSAILQSLFELMKPGAYVFFSDSGNSDAYETVSVAAKGAGLIEIESVKQQLVEKVSKQLPAIGPLKMGQRPLKYTYACSAVWKNPV